MVSKICGQAVVAGLNEIAAACGLRGKLTMGDGCFGGERTL